MILHLLLIIQTLTVTSFQTKKIIPLASQNGKAELAGLLKPKNHVGLRNTTRPKTILKTILSEAETKKKHKFGPGIAEGMVANMAGAAAGNIMNAAAPFLADIGLGGVTDAMCTFGFGDCSSAPDNTQVMNLISEIGADLKKDIGALQEDITGLTNDVAEMDSFLREMCSEFRQEFVNIGANQAEMKEQLRRNFKAIKEGFDELSNEVDAMGKQLKYAIDELGHQGMGNNCNNAAHEFEIHYDEYINGHKDLETKIPQGNNNNFQPFELELKSFQDNWIAKKEWLNSQYADMESCLVPKDSSVKGYFESYYLVLKNQPISPKSKLDKLAVAFEFYMGSLTEADEMLYTSFFSQNRHDYTTSPSNTAETNRMLNVMNAHFKSVRGLRKRWGFRLSIIRTFWQWAGQIFNDAAFSCRLGYMHQNYAGSSNMCSTLNAGDCPQLQEFGKYWEYLSTRWPEEWTRPQKSIASFGIGTTGNCYDASYGSLNCYSSFLFRSGPYYYRSKYMARYCGNNE